MEGALQRSLLGVVYAMWDLHAMEESVESVTGDIATTHLQSVHHVTRLSLVHLQELRKLKSSPSMFRENFGTCSRTLKTKNNVRFPPPFSG